MRVNLPRKILLAGIISITLILGMTVTRVSAVPPTATVAVESRYNFRGSISAEFTINLTVLDAEDIQSWEANVTFDPAVLEFVSCAEGEFLKRKAFPTDFMYNNRTERVLLSAAYMMIGPPGVGISGDGQLANITFRVKTAVNSTIHLDDEYTTLTYNDGSGPALQPRRLYDGFFTIKGDIDCDGDVDWVDFGDFATAYGSKGPPQVPAPEPNYNYRADFDSDGDVDWVDFGDFATQYGNSTGS